MRREASAPAGRVSMGSTLARAVADEAGEGAAGLRAHERRAWTVAAVSLGVMLGELAAGAWLNSLALQSDGLHSGAHAGVLGIAGCAYVIARRRPPGAVARILNLAAMVSAALLAVAAAGLGLEALHRFLHPEAVRFGEAALITAVGLAVSGVSAVILRGGHAHAHVGFGTAHAHGRDLNLWAAYLHMIADVTTSVLALAALLAGAVTGWTWLDAAVGLLNALVVAGFSARLLHAAGGAVLGGRRSAA